MSFEANFDLSLEFGHFSVISDLIFDDLVKKKIWGKCIYFSEFEGFLVVDGIETVRGDDFGPELFSNGVGWEAKLQ